MTRTRHRDNQGFTLIEMLIVVSIIGILLSLAIPSYRQSLVRAREAVLKENLYTLRQTIEQFTLDKQRPPPRDIPGSADTWEVESSDLAVSPEQTVSGISDVRSGSAAVSSEGTPYNTW